MKRRDDLQETNVIRPLLVALTVPIASMLNISGAAPRCAQRTYGFQSLLDDRNITLEAKAPCA